MGGLGRFNHLVRRIRIESKVFSLEFDEYSTGSVIKLLEKSSHGCFELKVDLKGAHWLENCFLEVVQNISDRKCFCIYRFNRYQLWINSFENNRGDILKVSSIVGNSSLKSILIPMGNNAGGWSDYAKLVLSIFPARCEANSQVARKVDRVIKEKFPSSDIKPAGNHSGMWKTFGDWRGVSYAESLVFGEWIRAVVNGHDSWSFIQKALSNSLEFLVELKPFLMIERFSSTAMSKRLLKLVSLESVSQKAVWSFPYRHGIRKLIVQMK